MGSPKVSLPTLMTLLIHDPGPGGIVYIFNIINNSYRSEHIHRTDGTGKGRGRGAKFPHSDFGRF